MTYAYEGEPEKRRAGVGAKVLIFGVSIFAVLGAFWTVVWFIRSYVEQPRIAARAPMTLASRESEPAPPLREPTAREPIAAAAVVPPPSKAPSPASTAAADPPPQHKPAVQLAGPAPSAAPAPAAPAADGAINDRWFPANPAPVPWPDPPNSGTAPSALAPAARTEPEPEPVEEVVASMQPAIAGAVPKPRPKPPANSASARLREPPLPRPRPDGSAAAPQSVWTAVPVSDDRFPQAPQQ